MIAAKTSEIDILKNDVEDKKGQISALNQEIENKDNLNETIAMENESMKINIADKESNLTRCTDAVRNARDKMRLICAENKEL